MEVSSTWFTAQTCREEGKDSTRKEPQEAEMGTTVVVLVMPLGSHSTTPPQASYIPALLLAH